MRTSEFLLFGALAACHDVPYDTGVTVLPPDDGLTPYDSSSVTESVPTGTGTPEDSSSTGTDTSEPAEPGVVNTTSSLCAARLAELGILDSTVLTPRVPNARPTLEAGEMRDVFSVLPGDSSLPISACARFTPQDGSYVSSDYPDGTAQAVLGARVTRASTRLNLQVDPINPEPGVMVVYLATQDEDGSFRGFTVPSNDSTNPARVYSVFWDDQEGRYMVIP